MIQRLAASLVEAAANRKLAPVLYLGPHGSPTPRRPFCAATYVSIDSTCSSECPFLAKGCYIKSSLFTSSIIKRLDGVKASATQAIAGEIHLMDRAFNGGPIPQDGGRNGQRGRDIRLHVSGDVATEGNAKRLAAAVIRWQARGGGSAWAYTHDWSRIPREVWSSVSALASVETPEQATRARSQGYAVAIVVPRFPAGSKAFSIPGMPQRVVPCPAETTKATCVTCRLCLDADALLVKDIAIAFSAHGRDAKTVIRRLPVLLPGGQLRLALAV